MQDKETKPPLFCRSILDRIVSQNEFPMPSVHQQGDQKTGSLDYYTGRMRGFHVIYLADTSMPVQTPVSDIDGPVGTSMQYSIGHVFSKAEVALSLMWTSLLGHPSLFN